MEDTGTVNTRQELFRSLIWQNNVHQNISLVNKRTKKKKYHNKRGSKWSNITLTIFSNNSVRMRRSKGVDVINCFTDRVDNFNGTFKSTILFLEWFCWRRTKGQQIPKFRSRIEWDPSILECATHFTKHIRRQVRSMQQQGLHCIAGCRVITLGITNCLIKTRVS